MSDDSIVVNGVRYYREKPAEHYAIFLESPAEEPKEVPFCELGPVKSLMHDMDCARFIPVNPSSRKALEITLDEVKSKADSWARSCNGMLNSAAPEVMTHYFLSFGRCIWLCSRIERALRELGEEG